MIVEGKTGLGRETFFEFKYIPHLHKTTERGTPRDKKSSSSSGAERRNANILLVLLGTIFTCLFLAALLARAVCRVIRPIVIA